MLPVKRWPMFIVKVLRTIVAPQRWALRAELRNEKLLEVCRRQHEAAKQAEIDNAAKWQQIAAAHANEKRAEREVHKHTLETWQEIGRRDSAEAERLSRELADERERHAETRQQLAILEGEKLVTARQIELQEQIIQKYLEIEACEARNHAAKYQGRLPEESP